MTQRDFIKKWLSSQNIKDTFISSWISHLWFFGSYSRNEATKDSDLDLLIELDWNHNTTFSTLDKLEELLKKEFKIKKVDFVSKRKLHPYLKPYIEKDLINIF